MFNNPVATQATIPCKKGTTTVGGPLVTGLAAGTLTVTNLVPGTYDCQVVITDP